MADAMQTRAQRVVEGRAADPTYELTRAGIRAGLFRYLALTAEGAEHLDRPGPLLVAPVHRSNLDAPIVASLAHRRIRALAKHTLFANPVLAWYFAALGALPVHRGEADRDALRLAQDLLERGEAIIVFPEGTRQSGSEVGEVFHGVAYLAAHSGAPVVPVGIAGTEASLPAGKVIPRRHPVRIVVGAPLDPPTAPGRVPRDEVRAFTDRVRSALQDANDQAWRRLAEVRPDRQG